MSRPGNSPRLDLAEGPEPGVSSGSPAPAPPGLVALSGAATGSGGGGSPPVEWGSGRRGPEARSFRDAHPAVDRCRRRPDGPLGKYGHRRRRTEPEPTHPQRRTTPRTHTMLSTAVRDDPMGRCGSTDDAISGASRTNPPAATDDAETAGVRQRTIDRCRTPRRQCRSLELHADSPLRDRPVTWALPLGSHHALSLRSRRPRGVGTGLEESGIRRIRSTSRPRKLGDYIV